VTQHGRAVSIPVIRSISGAITSLMPPRRGRLNASRPLSLNASSMSLRVKPSETTTSGARPLSCAFETSSQTSSMLSGTSGMRIAWAPAAMPACSAIQPTCRPMTSATMHRWWESPVVRRRSIASEAMFTAVSKPNE
jgi:hypothetical protein